MSSSTLTSPAFSERVAAQPLPEGRATAILLIVAALQFLLVFATIGRYGYFSDEFYYWACSEHLDWGYIDHPPLSIALLALNRWIFGDSIWVLRLPPALATAAVVVITGLMARRLGAGSFGQGLAALSAAVSPMYLIFASFYSMNPFDLLFWTLGSYVILGILKNDAPKGWLLFGLVAGLGLENKLSMAFFGLGLCIALVLTKNRKYIFSRVDGKIRPGLFLFGGGALAILIFLPHLIWQALNDWPTVEFLRSLSRHQFVDTSPLVFLFNQAGIGHPFPIALAGLYFYLFSQPGRPYRMIGIIYVSVFVLFMVQDAKPYYLAAAYPMLFAGGAVLIESFAQRMYWRVLKPGIVIALVACLVLVLPFILPVLPPKQLLAYQEFLGIVTPQAELPRYLSKRLGWEELAAEVARIYETLTEKEQKETVVMGGTYQDAGAIDFFSKEYNLPPAISYHHNYYLWGPGDTSWGLVIAVRVPKEWLEGVFDEVVEAGGTSCGSCADPYRNLPVYVCREPTRPIAEVWAEWNSKTWTPLAALK
jgi:hypothetical protein